MWLWHPHCTRNMDTWKRERSGIHHSNYTQMFLYGTVKQEPRNIKQCISIAVFIQQHDSHDFCSQLYIPAEHLWFRSILRGTWLKQFTSWQCMAEKIELTRGHHGGACNIIGCGASKSEKEKQFPFKKYPTNKHQYSNPGLLVYYLLMMEDGSR